MATEIINISRLHLVPRKDANFDYEPVSDLSKNEACPVCLRGYDTVEKDHSAPPCTAVRLLPCGHIIGKYCMKKHQKRTGDRLCPYCRQQLECNRGRPAQLTTVQKFFQRISETDWYQSTERLLLFSMTEHSDTSYRIYKEMRLKLQQGSYHNSAHTQDLIDMTRYLSAKVSSVDLVLVSLPAVFCPLGLYMCCAICCSAVRTYLGYTDFGQRFLVLFLDRILLWPVVCLLLIISLRLLHDATSRSIIHREVERANAAY